MAWRLHNGSGGGGQIRPSFKKSVSCNWPYSADSNYKGTFQISFLFPVKIGINVVIHTAFVEKSDSTVQAKWIFSCSIGAGSAGAARTGYTQRPKPGKNYGELHLWVGFFLVLWTIVCSEQSSIVLRCPITSSKFLMSVAAHWVWIQLFPNTAPKLGLILP